jgi:hypothetical protein
MDMSIELIYYQLQERFSIPASIFLHLTEREKIRRWSYYTGQANLDEKILYVATRQEQELFSRATEGHSIILISDSLGSRRIGSRDLIVVEQVVDIYALSNMLTEIISGFQEWYSEVNDVMSKTGDLQHIVDISHTYLPCMYHIHDADFRTLAYSQELLEKYPENRKDLELIPLSYVDEKMHDSDYKKADFYHGVFQHPASDEDDICHCYNLFVHNKSFGRVVIQGSRHSYLPGRAFFLSCLGEIFDNLLGLYFEQFPIAHNYLSFQTILASLLSGNYQDSGLVSSALNLNRWEVNHRYQVIKMRFSYEGYESYYCIQLEKLFGDCCVIKESRGVYCIINWSLNTRERNRQSEREFKDFLRENLCKAGTSSTFEDIYEVYVHSLEAEVALATGEKIDPHFWYFIYSDYTMEHIMEQATAVLPANSLIHPALKTLRSYDSEQGTQLLDTLHQLIKSKYNVTQASKELHVHRTTFIQRMARIEELTGIMLKDYEELLHIMLSFHIQNSQ